MEGRSTFSGGSIWRRQECYTLPIWLAAMGSADGLTGAHGPAGEEVGLGFFRKSGSRILRVVVAKLFAPLVAGVADSFGPAIGGGLAGSMSETETMYQWPQICTVA
jgi:hypothetical protein